MKDEGSKNVHEHVHVHVKVNTHVLTITAVHVNIQQMEALSNGSSIAYCARTTPIHALHVNMETERLPLSNLSVREKEREAGRERGRG